MMEAVRTSEMSVYFETTRRYNLESCRLHTRRRENLKSHNSCLQNIARVSKRTFKSNVKVNLREVSVKTATACLPARVIAIL